MSHRRRTQITYPRDRLRDKFPATWARALACPAGWGRHDKVCFPSQAKRALTLFPDARLYWFERCGHFPPWDAPQETVQLILNTSASQIGPSTAGTPVAQSAILGASAGAA